MSDKIIFVMGCFALLVTIIVREILAGRLTRASGTSGSAQDATRLDPKGAGPTVEDGDAQ